MRRLCSATRGQLRGNQDPPDAQGKYAGNLLDPHCDTSTGTQVTVGAMGVATLCANRLR
jgi:hypothetical protein